MINRVQSLNNNNYKPSFGKLIFQPPEATDAIGVAIENLVTPRYLGTSESAKREYHKAVKFLKNCSRDVFLSLEGNRCIIKIGGSVQEDCYKGGITIQALEYLKDIARMWRKLN